MPLPLVPNLRGFISANASNTGWSARGCGGCGGGGLTSLLRGLSLARLEPVRPESVKRRFPDARAHVHRPGTGGLQQTGPAAGFFCKAQMTDLAWAANKTRASSRRSRAAVRDRTTAADRVDDGQISGGLAVVAEGRGGVEVAAIYCGRGTSGGSGMRAEHGVVHSRRPEACDFPLLGRTGSDTWSPPAAGGPGKLVRSEAGLCGMERDDLPFGERVSSVTNATSLKEATMKILITWGGGVSLGRRGRAGAGGGPRRARHDPAGRPRDRVALPDAKSCMRT